MINIYICVGSACHLKGSYNIINQMQDIINEKKLSDKVVIKAALCLGECTNAVSVRVEDEEVISLSIGNVREFFENNIIPRLNF
ncbi:MAG TPA: (2Fe-2S) ferredoxin domain-containing protein [Clostridia bacterium]|nr:(2Fe-2S) ferredoxin domain-containing protein [Clostridia bacterium]